MKLIEAYNKLIEDAYKKESNRVVKEREGIFNGENDLIYKAYSRYYLSLDKEAMIEILKNIENKLLEKTENELTKNSFEYFGEIIIMCTKEAANFFGPRDSNKDPLSTIIKNSKTSEDESMICTFSDLKNQGVGECAENSALIFNCATVLYYAGVINEKPIYVRCQMKTSSQNGGHAIIAFEHINIKGEKSYILYDPVNPIKTKDNEVYYAFFSLSEEMYIEFINGKPLDNINNVYNKEESEERTYYGYIKKEYKFL